MPAVYCIGHLPVRAAGAAAVVVPLQCAAKLPERNIIRRCGFLRFLFRRRRCDFFFLLAGMTAFHPVVFRLERLITFGADFRVQFFFSHFGFLSHFRKPSTAIAKLNAYKSACA